MQIAFSPPEAGEACPLAVIVTSEGEADARQDLQAEKGPPIVRSKHDGLSISESKASLIRNPKRVLDDVDVSPRIGTHLDPSWSTPANILPSISCEDAFMIPPPAMPLNIRKTTTTVTNLACSRRISRANRPGGSNRTQAHHPIISKLLQDIECAMKEWQVIDRI